MTLAESALPTEPKLQQKTRQHSTPTESNLSIETKAETAPQTVASAGDWSLVSALAAAGGPLKDASLTQVALVRGSLTEPKVALVDYRAILKGEATDVRLQPGDIVYVPLTPYYQLTRYVDLILNTFVRTVGANEGARAVVRNPSAVGLNVPLGP